MLHRGCEVNTHTHTAQKTFYPSFSVVRKGSIVSWHGHKTKRPLVRGDFMLPLRGSGGREEEFARKLIQ